MYGTTNTPLLLKVPFGFPAKHSPQNIVFFVFLFICIIQVDPHIRGFSYPLFTAAGKKNRKIKEISVSKFQNERQARTGRNMVKSSSPKAPRG